MKYAAMCQTGLLLVLQSALGAEQFSWLLNDLARVNRAVTPWVTVSWHQPPVSP